MSAKLILKIEKGTKVPLPNLDYDSYEGKKDIKHLELIEDIEIELKAKTVFMIENPLYELYLDGCDLDRLKEEIIFELGFNYVEYGMEDDENLMCGAKELKYKMLEICKEVR